jgi:hypothetical protein
MPSSPIVRPMNDTPYLFKYLLISSLFLRIARANTVWCSILLCLNPLRVAEGNNLVISGYMYDGNTLLFTSLIPRSGS